MCLAINILLENWSHRLKTNCSPKNPCLFLSLAWDMWKVFHNFRQICLIKYWFFLWEIFRFSLHVMSQSLFLFTNHWNKENQLQEILVFYQINTRFCQEMLTLVISIMIFLGFLSYSKIIYDAASLSNLRKVYLLLQK